MRVFAPIFLSVCMIGIMAQVPNNTERMQERFGSYYLNNTKEKIIISQDYFTKPDTTYVIQHDYDLNGKTIELPEGCTLQFKGGSINHGTIILKSNTVIRGNKSICEALFNGLSHKSLFVANNVENIEIYDLTLKGNYFEDKDGMINPWGQERRDAQNLLFIGNSNNIYINGLSVINFANDNQGENVEWNVKDSTNIGFAAVKIANSENVVVKRCSEHYSAGEGWEFNFCNHITIDSLYIKRKYGVSSLNVEGCHNFNLLNSVFETEISTGDIVNILAKNALVDNCIFIGGGVDFGNEFANRGYEKIIKEYSETVTFSNCYFGGYLRNGSYITDNSPSKIVDNLRVIKNTYDINASDRNNIIALYLGNNGNVGTVLFENNIISITGKINDSYDYYYQIIESFSQAYVVDSLIIRGNGIYDKVFTKEGHYDNIISHHLNGTIIASNVNYLAIENNIINSCSGIYSDAKVYYPDMIHKGIVIKNNQMSFVCQRELVDLVARRDMNGNIIKQKVDRFVFTGNTQRSLKNSGYMGAFNAAENVTIENNVFNGVYGSFRFVEQGEYLRTSNNKGLPKIDGQFKRTN